MPAKKLVAYQGVIGAFSYLSAREIFPEAELVAFPSFSEALRAVKEQDFDYAILPVENSEAGRVADLHMLLPSSGLFITGEHYKRIEHYLLGVKGANLKTIKTVYSHPQALAQCSKVIEELKLNAISFSNTAAAAEQVAKTNDKSMCAIASLSAGKTYNLDVLKENVENSNNNTTRFLIIAKNLEIPDYNKDEKVITSLLFHLKNVPSALYDALGAFAKNHVNMTRIESCIGIGSFISANFFVDVEAHSEDENFKQALNDLTDKVEAIKIIGVYKASNYRNKDSA